VQAHFPAEHPPSSQGPRVPQADEHSKRTCRDPVPPAEGPHPAVGL
ncbi:MAG: LSU ribosomal protein L34p, partial [uncultured Acidimicrobiales bacterium]